MKFDKIQTLCAAGRQINEDSFSVSERYLLALDGASDLYGRHVTREQSDARWLARRGAEEFGRRLAERGAPMPELCREAAETLGLEFVPLAGPDAPCDAYPSAGLAALRLRGGLLEYYGLGDLTTLLRHRDGRVETIHDGTISRLDRSVIEEMVRLAESGGGPIAAQRSKVEGLLRKNRELRNRPGGYWIFDPTAVGADCGVCRRWPAEEIRSVAILSDGIADAVPIYRMAPDNGTFLNRLEREGPEAVCEELRRLQREDPDWNRYPRFKQADDTTVLLADLKAK